MKLAAFAFCLFVFSTACQNGEGATDYGRARFDEERHPGNENKPLSDTIDAAPETGTIQSYDTPDND